MLACEVLLRVLSLQGQFISDTVDGQNDFPMGQFLGDFFAQILDVAVDGPVIAFKTVSLNFIQQFAARENPLRKSDQRVEKAEFGGGQADLVSVDAHLAGVFIQENRAGDQSSRCVLAVHPPQHRLDARHDFAGTEGFADIIIGPDLQAEKPIHFFHLGGDHENGYV